MKPPTYSTTITFSPAIPCGTTDGLTYCGKPAHVAVVWSNYGGFGFQPVCRECTAKAAAIYGISDLTMEAEQNKGALPDERPTTEPPAAAA